MSSSTRGVFALSSYSFLWQAVMLTIILCLHTVSNAQGLNGANTSGTSGNDVIQGRIYFPRGHKSAMRPVVKLRGDSSSELTTVANVDGDFSFTHLRPDSYTIVVLGGDEYENVSERVAVSSPGQEQQ